MASKNDSPPFLVTVENGHLVPATAWDQERLDTFRRGAKLRVHITQDRFRKLERRYFAILNKTLKECATPWSNTITAHEALKLALGYVVPFKTANGNWSQYPRSFADFDDVELSEYYDEAMKLLSKITGVDVETLGREASDAGDEDDAPDQIEAQDETIIYDATTGEILDGEILTDEPNDGAAEPPAEASSEPGEDASADAPSPGDPLPLLLRYARDVMSLAKNDQPSATIVAVEKRYVGQMDDAEKEIARIIATTIRNFRNGKFRYDEAREKIASAGSWQNEQLETEQ